MRDVPCHVKMENQNLEDGFDGQVPSGAGLAPGRARPQTLPLQSGWGRLQDGIFVVLTLKSLSLWLL